MFFTDREKAIYEAPDGRRFDPLRVDRTLTVASGGQLDQWIATRNAVVRAPILNPDGTPTGEYELLTGDVSAAGKATAAVEAARAEIMLADAARVGFDYRPFPDGPPDAVVLETLYHFLGWLEGKGGTVETPRSSPTDLASPEVVGTLGATHLTGHSGV